MGWLDSGRPAQLRQRCTELLRPRKDIETQKSDEQPINSPLFKTLIDYVQTAGRCSVLDLGPAFGSNVTFFGELRCKLQIADCAAALLELNAREEIGPEVYARELQRLLPLAGKHPFDVILTWDLLNYLHKPLYTALMTHLSPCVSGDTWLHAYISSRRDMAASPQQYRPNHEGRVVLMDASAATQPSPCYPQQTLRTLMPRFDVSRATLLQNGMQEYLFKGQGRGHRQT
ncbi:MAG: hypothetical protein KKA36_06275 [Gammaproteobacteria bacterium]|nr:hypothetical protein [Gammaproteobacteria bacterium]